MYTYNCYYFSFPGLRDEIRIDCACHRLHTVFSSAYKQAQEEDRGLKDYETAISSLCGYVKKTTGLQETLPVSVKQGGVTRPWTSIYRRAHSVHQSYTKLTEKLSERGRLPLIAAVDKKLNEEIMTVSSTFKEIFETLQYSDRPTLHLVVPSYYKLLDITAEAPQDSTCISVFKAQLRHFLDEKYYTSITQMHWVATFCDPGFREFPFLPKQTAKDRKFRQDLQEDMPKWIALLSCPDPEIVQDPEGPEVGQNPDDSVDLDESPPTKKRFTSIFGAMRSNLNRRSQLQLTLKQEFDSYVRGDITAPCTYDEDNPLSWWSTNHVRLPKLAKIVRRVLCCPASSAQSERDFSHTGLTLTGRRSLLTPKYVGALELLASAHRCGI